MTEHPHDGPHGYASDKEAYLKRMRRIEGQVRGIARMVDEDVYCIDILTQVAAVTKALQAVSIGLVEDHISHCVVDAARQSPEEGAAKVKEASDAIARLVRS
jgi:DNA-binding FrmR family transcriptional regulator